MRGPGGTTLGTWGRLLAAGVPFLLAAGACSGASPPPPAPVVTTSAAPSANDWLAGGGQERAKALGTAANGVLTGDFASVDRGRCQSLQAVVADDVAWTEEHDVPDAQLDRAWQSALTNYGAAADKCLDAVDSRDVATTSDSLTDYLGAVEAASRGADALVTFFDRVPALLPS